MSARLLGAVSHLRYKYIPVFMMLLYIESFVYTAAPTHSIRCLLVYSRSFNALAFLLSSGYLLSGTSIDVAARLTCARVEHVVLMRACIWQGRTLRQMDPIARHHCWACSPKLPVSFGASRLLGTRVFWSTSPQLRVSTVGNIRDPCCRTTRRLSRSHCPSGLSQLHLCSSQAASKMLRLFASNSSLTGRCRNISSAFATASTLSRNLQSM
jgi:hypothetical protein